MPSFFCTSPFDAITKRMAFHDILFGIDLDMNDGKDDLPIGMHRQIMDSKDLGVRENEMNKVLYLFFLLGFSPMRISAD